MTSRQPEDTAATDDAHPVPPSTSNIATMAEAESSTATSQQVANTHPHSDAEASPPQSGRLPRDSPTWQASSLAAGAGTSLVDLTLATLEPPTRTLVTGDDADSCDDAA
eukprot:CAMPEP_0176460074 /NCGR_PEP_ID=MMETSP0127-20121128/33726_1 /TAXON_ID=938130 /ORGANISM="Platyophrya macrostoma, Strain WH" /LENGTH=108 /DNA_ID=CAMNT_0017851273 /DNA_START=37 /DNA_END=359 /DNA_ORIENTATION=+